MCKNKKEVEIEVTITSYIDVDPCLAEEIKFLNKNGIRTIEACCGHGEPDDEGVIYIWYQDTHKARALGYEVEVESDGKDDDGSIKDFCWLIRPKSNQDALTTAKIREDRNLYKDLNKKLKTATSEISYDYDKTTEIDEDYNIPEIMKLRDICNKLLCERAGEEYRNNN